MIIETLTLSTIIGAGGLAVWFAKAKFQPEIERRLTKIEGAPSTEEATIAKHMVSNKSN